MTSPPESPFTGPSPFEPAGFEPSPDPPEPTEPPEPPPPTTGPGPLRRSTTDEVLGGVCGGLGQATGVDPLWFRLGFVFLALSTGIGLLLYIVLWVAVPEATDDVTAGQGHTGSGRTPKPGDGAILFGLFLVVVGSALLVDVALPWFDRVLWPAAVMAVGAGLLYLGTRR